MSYRSVLLVCFLILVATGSHAGGKDDPFLIMGKLDQLEVRDTEGDDPLVLEGAVWAGYDLNKVWLKADVERVDSETEELELQALYGRAIAPFWDIQLGARKDLEPKPSREWGVIALRGLAPYLFDVGASLFIGGAGRTALRLEANTRCGSPRSWCWSRKSSLTRTVTMTGKPESARVWLIPIWDCACGMQFAGSLRPMLGSTGRKNMVTARISPVLPGMMSKTPNWCWVFAPGFNGLGIAVRSWRSRYDNAA